MNIIDIQDNLKNFSQDQLIQEMQSPSGMAPQFLILSELTRRKKMKDDYNSQISAQEPTVAEEAISGAGVPQAGLAGMAQAMAPKSSIAQNDAVNMGITPSMVPDNTGMPIRMQEGGAISDQMLYEQMSQMMKDDDEYPKPPQAYFKQVPQEEFKATEPYFPRVPKGGLSKMNEGGVVGGGFEGVEDKGGIFGALGRSEILRDYVGPMMFGPLGLISKFYYDQADDSGLLDFTEDALPMTTPQEGPEGPQPKDDTGGGGSNDGAGGGTGGGSTASVPGLSAIDAAYKPLIDAMSAGREDRYKAMEKQIADLEARQKQARDESKYYALLKTGLGLMGSKQPTLGGALGEAGLAGVQAYQDAQGRYEQGLREVMQARTGLSEAQRKEDIDLAKLQSEVALKKYAASASAAKAGSLTPMKAFNMRTDILKNIADIDQDLADIMDTESLAYRNLQGVREALVAQLGPVGGSLDKVNTLSELPN